MDAASYAGNDFRAMRTLTRKTILEFFARNPMLRDQRGQDSLICIVLAVIFRGCHDHPEPMTQAGCIMP
jgi:hypothetical protein